MHGSLRGGVVHFYEHRPLELWASVKDFHQRKFGELSVWKSYKWPLKQLIFAFTNDMDYLWDKEKVASLNFGTDGDGDVRLARRRWWWRRRRRRKWRRRR